MNALDVLKYGDRTFRGSLDDYMVYQFYGHKREHSAQVAAFIDVLQGKGSALVHSTVEA